MYVLYEFAGKIGGGHVRPVFRKFFVVIRHILIYIQQKQILVCQLLLRSLGIKYLGPQAFRVDKIIWKAVCNSSNMSRVGTFDHC